MASMQFKPVCPLYGRDEDQCAMGIGYISPHDVEVIVRHCTARFGDCLTYQTQAEKESRMRAAMRSGAAQGGAVAGADGPRPGAGPVDREALTALHHELRTPLTSIQSFTEILLRYPIEDLDSKRHFLSIIHEEAQRLGRTVDAVFGNPDTPEPAAEAAALSRRCNTLRRGDGTAREHVRS